MTVKIQKAPFTREHGDEPLVSALNRFALKAAQATKGRSEAVLSVTWTGSALDVEVGFRPEHVIVTGAQDATDKVPASLYGPAWAAKGTAVSLSGFGNATAGHKYFVRLLVLGA